MNRKIKFRIWDKINKKWLNCFNANLLNIGDLSNVELMQYTGLKDIEDYEIYEDDIVWNEWDEEYQVVIFVEGEYKVKGKTSVQNLYNNLDFIEICGNVHENFEIVKAWYKEE